MALVVDALVGFRFVHKALQDWQGNGRLPLWAAALAMFHDAPLLGQGPNSYVLHYRTYLAALHFPTWMEIDPRVTPWAHNLYVELLAEQGFVGLGAFLALGAVGLSMVKRINKCQRSDIHCLGAAPAPPLSPFDRGILRAQLHSERGSRSFSSLCLGF